MSHSAFKFILIGFTIVTAMGSCVPIAIGAAGAAAGYIARDEGIGVVESANPNSSSYDSSDPPVY